MKVSNDMKRAEKHQYSRNRIDLELDACGEDLKLEIKLNKEKVIFAGCYSHMGIGQLVDTDGSLPIFILF